MLKSVKYFLNFYSFLYFIYILKKLFYIFLIFYFFIYAVDEGATTASLVALAKCGLMYLCRLK